MKVDPRATPYTDAAPPGEPATIVVLGGAIKAWWETCIVCKGEKGRHYEEIGHYVKCANCHGTGEMWDSEMHREYIDWRNEVRHRLIQERCLTYAPHEAFKGTWDERAQAINDAAIRASDVFLVMSPPEVVTEGTDDEARVAREALVSVVYAPPGTDLDNLVRAVSNAALGGPGFP